MNDKWSRRALFLLLGLLLAAVCVAQPAYRVKDINQGAQAPVFFEGGGAALQGRVYFALSDRNTGSELWTSDGTPEGTRLFLDIAPGPVSSSPEQFVSLNGKIYFVASPAGTTAELWVTDGTAAGTHSVVSGAQTGSPSNLITVGDRLFFLGPFTGSPPSTGAPRLWVSDGTAEGTRLIPINPDSPLVKAGTSLYFLAVVDASRPAWGLFRISSGSSSPELVRSGLRGPTVSRPPVIASPSGLTAVGSLVFFAADTPYDVDAPPVGDELWRSDGTAEGTVMVRDIRPGPASSWPSALTAVGGRLFFVASENGGFPGLWTSDGTAEGTVPILAPGSGQVAREAFPLGVLGNSLIFSYRDPASQTMAIASTDGRPSEAVLLKRIAASAGVAIGGQLLFSASDPEHGKELWKTDGTAEGTVLVRDVFPGPSDSGVTGFTTFGTWATFGASDGRASLSLWATDGTEQGTRVLRDLEFPSSNPSLFVAWGSRVVFAAVDHGAASNDASRRLWISDGTEEGTRKLVDRPVRLQTDIFGTVPVVWRNELYFSASDEAGSEPWKSDGTEAGTVRLIDIDAGPESSNPVSFTPFADALGFFAREPSYPFLYQLWTTDGTEAGTTRVNSSPEYGFLFSTLSRGLLYFAGGDPDHGEELWRSDGTAAGTTLLGDIDPGPRDSNPQLPTEVDGNLFFVAFDGLREGLWRTDGTPTGTAMIKVFEAGTNFSGVYRASAGFKHRFFAIVPGVTHSDFALWRSDRTEAGTVLVRELPGRSETDLTVVGDVFFFVLRDELHGAELWKSDGTADGTMLVKDILPGSLSSSPSNLTGVDGVLLFTADDGVHGMEVWRSDGTEEGTFLADDIYPGAAGSNPSGFTRAGDLIFFAAEDQESGRELWAMPVSALGADSRRRARSPMEVPFRR